MNDISSIDGKQFRGEFFFFFFGGGGGGGGVLG
jgi:hypothetical protein